MSEAVPATTLADVITALVTVLKPYMDHRGTPYVNLPMEVKDVRDKVEPVALKSRQARVYVRRRMVPAYPTKPVPESDLQHVLDVLEGHAVTAPRKKTPTVSVILDEKLQPVMEVLEVMAKKGGIKAPAHRLLERIHTLASALNIPLSQLPKDKQELGNVLAKLSKGGMKVRGVVISYDDTVKPREWHIRLKEDDRTTHGMNASTDEVDTTETDTDETPADTGESPPDPPNSETPVSSESGRPASNRGEVDTPESELSPSELAELAEAEAEINKTLGEVKS